MMTKKSKSVVKKVQAKMAKARSTPRPVSMPKAPSFGAVSAISTAPVAIGNSMSGSKPVTIPMRDGMRVVARDFAFTAASTGTLAGWLPVGGMPLSPTALVSSVLKAYCQIYNKFRINRICFHYITSSATTSTGDILFSYNTNRTDPLPNWTGTNFLPYALSREETIIGPQWTNHSCCLSPTKRWCELAFNTDSPPNNCADGELILFSKTSTTDSPGYVLVDYDITFKEMSINPRAGLIPDTQFLFGPAQFYAPTTALTVNTSVVAFSTGTTWAGQAITALYSQSSERNGDIYKVSFDATNSNAGAWTVSAGATPTLATLVKQQYQASSLATNLSVTLADGYTVYTVANGSANWEFYATVENAMNQVNPFVAGFTGTPSAYADNSHSPNAGVWLYAIVSLVANCGSAYYQQQ